MTSPPLDSTHGQTTLGVALHHYTWVTRKGGRRRAWHDITALGQHTLSATSGVERHHRPWIVLTVERRWARHAIFAFGKHTRSNDVGCGMPSSHLGSAHGRTTSDVACHHHLWAAQTVEQRRAWHDITALGLHEWSDDVGRGITSPTLDSTHGQQRRACHDITALASTHGRHRRLGLPLLLLDCTQDRTTSGMA